MHVRHTHLFCAEKSFVSLVHSMRASPPRWALLTALLAAVAAASRHRSSSEDTLSPILNAMRGAVSYARSTGPGEVKGSYIADMLEHHQVPEYLKVEVPDLPPSSPAVPGVPQNVDHPCFGEPKPAGFEIPSHVTPCSNTAEPCGDFGVVHLIINTGVGYEPPAIKLLQSLACAGFNDWSKLVLINGGDNLTSGPRLELPSAILGANASNVTAGLNVVTIRTPFMNVDLTGYAALYKYRNHPLVKNSAYMYLLGTSLVTVRRRASGASQPRKARLLPFASGEHRASLPPLLRLPRSPPAHYLLTTCACARRILRSPTFALRCASSASTIGAASSTTRCTYPHLTRESSAMPWSRRTATTLTCRSRSTRA